MAAGLVVACAALAGGCASTQQKNERAKLVADRELGSRRAQRVTGTSRDVRVTDAALVRGRDASAVVVTLRSRAGTALTDLPIVVGVREPGGRRTALNAGRNLDWFQTHVPALAPGGRTTWVFLTRRRLPAGARAWARLGAGAQARDVALPRIEAVAAGARAGERVRVALDNVSEIPQYGLQVYALVQRGGRYVAAGKAAIRHLGTHAQATARIALVGARGQRSVRVHATPTIFE